MIQQIEHLARNLLTKPWQPLTGETLLDQADWSQPGVYALAYSKRLRAERPIDDLGTVFYVGMSRATKGVRYRLQQFLYGIETDSQHSGAMRFFKEYAGGVPFSEWRDRKRFFAVVLTVPCQVKADLRTSSDLRQIGHVVCLEYYVRAFIKERTDRDPELNKQ